jgi:hypothetical protein
MGASYGARRALERNSIMRADHASVAPGVHVPPGVHRVPGHVHVPTGHVHIAPGGQVRPTPQRRASDKLPPGFRKHERRWRDASFFLVERRRGRLYMYGSMGVAAALWTYIYLFVRFL